MTQPYGSTVLNATSTANPGCSRDAHTGAFPRTAIKRQGEIAATISNSIVGIFADSYGRGPTRAKTCMVDDYVFTVLEDILTTVKRTPVNNGHEDLVRA